MKNTPFESLRGEFPVAEKFIYLDHAGVSPLPLRVKKAIETYLSEATEGGAFHYPKWARQIVDVRRASAGLINASPDEIAFTKSTSHGLSIVAGGLDWKAGDNVVFYEKEFPSNLFPWLNLKKKGVEVRGVSSRGGKLLLDDLAGLMDSRTRLLALSSVQFANGFRADLKKTGELCRSRNILFCVDAIQSLGLIPMDVKAFHVDFLSADGHKWLLGPEGIGIFYCRKELAPRLEPPLIGWRSVKKEFDFDRPDFSLKSDAARFEEGSLNVMGVIGLGASLELLFEAGIDNIERRVLALGDEIIGEAKKRGFALRTPEERRERGGNVTFSGDFEPVKTREALMQQGIMVNARGGGLRVSPHFYNTEAEIGDLFTALDRLLHQ